MEANTMHDFDPDATPTVLFAPERECYSRDLVASGALEGTLVEPDPDPVCAFVDYVMTPEVPERARERAVRDSAPRTMYGATISITLGSQGFTAWVEYEDEIEAVPVANDSAAEYRRAVAVVKGRRSLGIR